MIVTTTPTIEGYFIKNYAGVVYESLSSDIDDSLARLRQTASQRGANAIVGLNINTWGSWDSPNIVVYGTAVVVEPMPTTHDIAIDEPPF